jgi:hypothetical protein
MSEYDETELAIFGGAMWVVWYGGKALLLAGAGWAGWSLGGLIAGVL